MSLTLIVGMVWSLTALAQPPAALVYKGKGSCDEGCSEAAALMAERAGFRAVYVAPETTDPKLFEGAVVWIQPGGRSRQVAETMNPVLKENLKAFIHGGGGYVGFCAGGFLATEKIADTKVLGLGILGGTADLYPAPNHAEAAIFTMSWEGRPREIYWEGGPYFKVPSDGSVETIATYPDGKVSTVRSHYGLGKVLVSGAHPEAPQWWRDAYHLRDSDGLDEDLAEAMIREAAGSGW
ncbi:MAG: BPL-N domain-containing protein [Bdellovibrionota bacterium]